MPSDLVVIVHGRPAPQGSKRHVGQGRMVEQSPHVRAWRAAVVDAAVDAMTLPPPWGKGDPLELCATFTLARPAFHWRTGKHSHLLTNRAPAQPITRPDLDKLLRSTLDALTDAGTLHDDAQVAVITACKTFPGGHPDALDAPGAVLTLRATGEW